MRAVCLLAAVLVVALGVVGGADGARTAVSRYVVVPGDSLWSISQRFGVSVDELAGANHLDPAGTLLAGTTLRVAPLIPLRRTRHVPVVYVVRPGDTLSGIAVRFDVSVRRLARVNRIDPAGLLFAGSRLVVPSAVAGAPLGITVTVRVGDTLSGIAARFGVPLASLSSLNGIRAPDLVFAGQRLRIPRVGKLAPSEELPQPGPSPYRSGSVGIDVSFPECDDEMPSPVGLSVVGLNAGRPFTTNPCFAEQFAAASAVGPVGVYLNASYAADLPGRVGDDCRSEAAAVELSDAERAGYALGCSEAAAALRQLEGRDVQTIWLDVEPENTWSDDPAVNRALITAFFVHLLELGRPVGVYSSAIYWDEITGGWQSLRLPEWIAASSNPGTCPARPFAAGPVWLSQRISISSGLDTDTAC